MSRPRLPTPPLPMDPALGTLWRPDETGEPGPLAADMGPLADGLIRVRKRCRGCARDFDGWMFVAHHRRRVADLERDLAAATEAGNEDRVREVAALVAEPFHVGLYRTCPDCTVQNESRAETVSLERRVELTQERWRRAKSITQRLPPARQLERLLKELTALHKFGSPRFKKCSDRLDSIQGWLGEHSVSEIAP